MEQFSAIRAQIHEIGCHMVDCDKGCDGVGNNKEEEILPRCLVFEINRRSSGRGSAIVGINPGQSGPVERQFYIENGPNYEQVLAFWDRFILKLRYYSRLRNFVDGLGFPGPILWTELVKCENGADGSLPPLQTFRTCTATYLKREMAIMPVDWPLIAVGWEAYKAWVISIPAVS